MMFQTLTALNGLASLSSRFRGFLRVEIFLFCFGREWRVERPVVDHSSNYYFLTMVTTKVESKIIIRRKILR